MLSSIFPSTDPFSLALQAARSTCHRSQTSLSERSMRILSSSTSLEQEPANRLSLSCSAAAPSPSSICPHRLFIHPFVALCRNLLSKCIPAHYAHQPAQLSLLPPSQLQAYHSVFKSMRVTNSGTRATFKTTLMQTAFLPALASSRLIFMHSWHLIPCMCWDLLRLKHLLQLSLEQ